MLPNVDAATRQKITFLFLTDNSGYVEGVEKEARRQLTHLLFHPYVKLSHAVFQFTLLQFKILQDKIQNH